MSILFCRIGEGGKGLRTAALKEHPEESILEEHFALSKRRKMTEDRIGNSGLSRGFPQHRFG